MNRLISLCSLSSLLSYLYSDLIIDVLGTEAAKREYYCTLILSFSTILGLIRLALPIAALGCTLLLIDRDLWTVSLLTLAGIPLLASNIRDTIEVCITNSRLEFGQALFLKHLMMLVLFIIVGYRIITRKIPAK
jgi:hypothetical protein